MYIALSRDRNLPEQRASPARTEHPRACPRSASSGSDEVRLAAGYWESSHAQEVDLARLSRLESETLAEVLKRRWRESWRYEPS